MIHNNLSQGILNPNWMYGEGVYDGYNVSWDPLNFAVSENGQIQAMLSNPAVSAALLGEIS